MGLFNDIVKSLLIENILLTEADDRIKKVSKIIDAEFGNRLNLDEPVSGPEYYVGGNPQTTWRVYLLFSLRHTFGLMTNADVKYLPLVAKLAFSDEVGFEKRDGNGTEIATLQNIIMLLKKDDALFQQVKANPNITFIELYEYLKPQLQTIADADSEAANNVEVRNDYDIIEVPDFETANYYGNYSSSSSRLCYTQDEETWNKYTNGGINKVYVCLKHGWEDIPAEAGEDNPYDEYGTSMIFVFIDPNGDIAYSNCRWNHNILYGHPYNGGVDHAFTKATLAETVGVRFDDVFKPYSDEELMEKDAVTFGEVQELLANGFEPDEIFEDVHEEEDGFRLVELYGKYNFVDENNELLYKNKWFDDAYDFYNRFARIKFNSKGWNFINTNGEIVFPNLWFSFLNNFDRQYGVAEVYIQDKGRNWIKKNGEFISPNQWFDEITFFDNGIAGLKLNSKGYNFINIKGELLSPNLWFDEINRFVYGLATVYIKDKGWNFINTSGKLLSPNQWFDGVEDFCDGFGIVRLIDKGYNYINTKGEILSPNQWFDWCLPFRYDETAKVEFNGTWHKIDRNGSILEGKSSKKSMITNNFKDMLNRMDEVRKNGSIIL